MSEQRNDIYTRVTNRIVAGLQQGVRPWLKPWNAEHAANSITRTETDDKGEECEREIPFLKGYTVFSAEQCDGLSAHFSTKVQSATLTPPQRLEAADRFFVATGADIRHG